MRLIFKDHFSPNGRNIGVPLVEIMLEKGGYQATEGAILDSGAEASLFGRETAEALGIDITDGLPVPMSGIGGQELAYAHIVTVSVPDADEFHTFPCRVLFKENVRQNLIGREDFFEVFRITFAKHEGYIQLDPVYHPYNEVR